MALDLCIQGDDGKPSHVVELSYSLHEQLLTLARRHRLAQLARLSDYYGDVVYAGDDVHALLEDLRVLREPAAGDPPVRDVVSALTSLVETAVLQGREVSALAD